MRRAVIALTLCSLLGACAILQDAYDDRRSDECRQLPSPNDQIECERGAFDEGVARRAQER